MIRFFDIVFSFLGLLILSPFFILISLLIALSSKGPIFFLQTRVGFHGNDFRLIKFRTMHLDADKKGLLTVGGRDSRITSVGYFLRKFKLDELPQLINVLFGSMSLVGPRPERPEFVAPLSDELLGYTDRLAVRPGVTGLAQIQLPADSDMQSVARKLSADLEYIRLRGFWLDFRLLFGTAIYLTGASYAIVRKVAMLPTCEQPTDIPNSIREIEPIARRIDHL